MKKKIIILLILISIFPVFSKEIALTFDDLPIVRQGESGKKMEIKIFNNILDILDKHNIKAAGFVVGRKIKQQYHKDLLIEFVKRGHVLGNHTYSHPDLNKTSVELYKKDILKCEDIIKPYIKGVKYFRHPMLHRGNSDLKKREIYRFLKKNNYTIASVSIDNDEYAYNIPARNAFKNKKNGKLMNVKKNYLAHMEKRITFFEKLSDKKLGREMKHILLLHMNFLNSIFLEDLIIKLKEKGWTFITLEKALEDPVYKLRDNYCGNKGLGWLERIE